MQTPPNEKTRRENCFIKNNNKNYTINIFNVPPGRVSVQKKNGDRDRDRESENTIIFLLYGISFCCLVVERMWLLMLFM